MAFLDSLGESINRASCVILGGLAGQEEILRYVLEPLQTGNPGYNGVGALYADRCGMPPPGRPQSGFAAGQCPTVYDLTVTRTRQDPGDIPRTNTVSVPLVRGKVGALGIDNPGGSTRLYVTGGLEGNPNANARYNVETSGIPGQPQPIFTNFFIASIVRRDGQPDNCEVTPPVAPTLPPGGNVTNENVTYVNNEGDTITIPVVLAFGYATINLDGTVNIPVNANFTLNPEFNGNFNFNFNTGETQPDVSPPNAPLPGSCDDPSGYGSDPDLPDPPIGLPDEPPFDPPADDPLQRESTIIGCIVTVTSVDDKSTVIFQDDNPDIYAPALGYVNFKIRIGESSAWTQDYPVKNLRQLIYHGWDGGAVAVRGSPRYGSVFTITPVRRRRSINPTFPPDTFEV